MLGTRVRDKYKRLGEQGLGQLGTRQLGTKVKDEGQGLGLETFFSEKDRMLNHFLS